MTRASRAVLPAALVAAGLVLLPAHAAPAPQWDTTRDAGRLGSDLAKFVVASPRLDRVNQGLDVVIVAGDTYPNGATETAVSDRDVGVTAYDANTGAVKWTTPVEQADVGVDSSLAGFEINEHNNNVYEIVNRGGDVLYRERAVNGLALSANAKASITGASAADSATDGAFVGVAGRQGANFLLAVYQTGLPTLEFLATPVAGEAMSVDMPTDELTGGVSLDYTRTVLATGTKSALGNGGDVFATAYNFRTHAKLWEASWAAAPGSTDDGIVAEVGWLDVPGQPGRGVGFVVGRTFTAATGWDIVVTAYDLATGALVWAETQRFDGGKNDVPVAAHFSRATGTLFIAGTSDRSPTTGDDVVVLAYDGATGALRNVAYSTGAVSQGDDEATGIVVTPDGQDVLVSAEIHQTSINNSQQAAIFGFDPALTPAGSLILGGAGDDHTAGLALSSTAQRVFLAGSSPDGTGELDHRAVSFSTADFAVTQEPVVPEIPWAPLAPVVAIALAAWWVHRQRTARVL